MSEAATVAVTVAEAALAEAVKAEAKSLPGDRFVSVPFNAVVLISWGLVSVHSRRLACFIAVLAAVINLHVTYQLTEVYAAAAWKNLPAADVTQKDVTDFLILGLVRWVSSLLYSASVCKLMVRFLPFADLFNKRLDVNELARIVYVASALFVAYEVVSGGEEWELETLQSITQDWSIYWYFYTSQWGDCLRAVLQVHFLLRSHQMLDELIERRQHSTIQANVFISSAAILFQNIHGYGLGLHSVLDIILQLFIMKKTWKHFRKAIATVTEETLALLCMIVAYCCRHSAILTYVIMVFTVAITGVLSLIFDLLRPIATWLTTVLTTAITRLNTAWHNYAPLPPQGLTNSANRLKAAFTRILSLVCLWTAIVVTQFGIAWRNYQLYLLEDDTIEQPVNQEEIGRHLVCITVVFHQTTPNTHVQCQHLIDRIVADRTCYMVMRPLHHHESVPQLMERDNAILELQPRIIYEPVRDFITSQHHLCSLESRPREAYRDTIGVLVPNK